MPEIPPGEGILSPAEAAAVLGLRPQALQRLEAEGLLTATRTLGGHRRYDEGSVRALRAERARISASVNGASSREVMSSGEAAAAFGVSRRVVAGWVRDGKLKGEWSDGHRLRVPAAEVARLLREGAGGT